MCESPQHAMHSTYCYILNECCCCLFPLFGDEKPFSLVEQANVFFLEQNELGPRIINHRKHHIFAFMRVRRCKKKYSTGVNSQWLVFDYTKYAVFTNNYLFTIPYYYLTLAGDIIDTISVLYYLSSCEYSSEFDFSFCFWCKKKKKK